MTALESQAENVERVHERPYETMRRIAETAFNGIMKLPVQLAHSILVGLVDRNEQPYDD